MTSKQLAEKTRDAYSYDAYAPGEWLAAIVALRRRRYTVDEVEAIMRSKWTRWARDACNLKHHKHTAACVLAFMANPRNRCTRAEVAAMVRESA